MARTRKRESNMEFFTIVQGEFVVKRNEENEHTRIRKYEDKEGNWKEKIEEVFEDLKGYVESIEVKDGDFGEQYHLKIVDGDETTMVCVPVSSRYGRSLVGKLPSCDFARKIRIKPYSFKDENDKTKQGVTIYQMIDTGNGFQDTKMEDYFLKNPDFEEDFGYIEEKLGKREFKARMMKQEEILIDFVKDTLSKRIETEKLNREDLFDDAKEEKQQEVSQEKEEKKPIEEEKTQQKYLEEKEKEKDNEPEQEDDLPF